MVDLKNLIRDIPDYPKPGILFKDITPLLLDPDGFAESVRQLSAVIGSVGCEAIVGIESRGFLFGTAVALDLKIGFVPIRKPGKLPYKTVSQSYELEYGTDSVEIHTDALRAGQRVVIVDDLLATGGTMAASCKLVESLGAEVAACAFVVELAFLEGRQKLKDYRIDSLISF